MFFVSNIRHILIGKKLRHFKTKSLNEFDFCQCYCSVTVSNYFSVTRFQLEHCQMTIHNKHSQGLKLVKSSTYTKQKH